MRQPRTGRGHLAPKGPQGGQVHLRLRYLKVESRDQSLDMKRDGFRARIDDDVLGLASDFMVVSSPAVAVGGLAAGPDERGRDHLSGRARRVHGAGRSGERFPVPGQLDRHHHRRHRTRRRPRGRPPRLVTCRFVAHG